MVGKENYAKKKTILVRFSLILTGFFTIFLFTFFIEWVVKFFRSVIYFWVLLSYLDRLYTLSPKIDIIL